MVDCCKHSKKHKKCIRKSDKNHLIFHENLLKKNVKILKVFLKNLLVLLTMIALKEEKKIILW